MGCKHTKFEHCFFEHYNHMNDIEDTTRYTAPPDSIPEPPTYLLSQIIRYVESWAPHPYNYHHTLEEVAEILRDAADNILDEYHGIDAQ